MMEQVPKFQRVLVLQGGGSLGAYEAGVYKALYEMTTKSDKERGFKGKPTSRFIILCAAAIS